MSKDEIIKEVAKEVELTKEQAKQAVNSVLNSIELALQKGEKVAFIGFGTFSVKDRPARTGRNPQTGEALEIAAKKVPVFKAGRTLKEAVK